ncbi:flagellar assembly protein FliW [uncultured Microbacterium sp.]|uniref:flagellar assembly protein FliW n=1 Tax=uncultured Microbacterium sp. TaxID=191216 RepID=UPI0025F5F89A|nr:flagellar assembly protein FliW [uncultured Microbacterium sp.]
MSTVSTDVVTVAFVSPPPGLHPFTDFELDAIPGASGLHALRAVDADVRLFVVDPAAIGHPYPAATLSAALATVSAEVPEEARVFVVVNPTAEGVRVNLRAPIVVHRRTGRATQTILEGQELPVRLLLDV